MFFWAFPAFFAAFPLTLGGILEYLLNGFPNPNSDELEKNVTIIYILTDPPVLFGGSQIREKNEVKGGAKPTRM